MSSRSSSLESTSTHSEWSQAATKQVQALLSISIKSRKVLNEIRVLIERERANPNSQNEDGITPLMYIGYIPTNGGPSHTLLLDMFTFFLSRPGINLNLFDSRGRLLIHHVVGWEDPNFLRVLLYDKSARQNIDSPTLHTGLSPLHLACSFPHVPVEIIERLLNAGADPNIQCEKFGRTPLHWVLATNNRPKNLIKVQQILDLFFQNRDTKIGDPFLSDKWGKTLLHYAAEFLHPKPIVDILLKKGESRSRSIMDVFDMNPMNQALLVGNTEAFYAIKNYTWA
jgi:ankyrin repeat protein